MTLSWEPLYLLKLRGKLTCLRPVPAFFRPLLSNQYDPFELEYNSHLPSSVQLSRPNMATLKGPGEPKTYDGALKPPPHPHHQRDMHSITPLSAFADGEQERDCELA